MAELVGSFPHAAERGSSLKGGCRKGYVEAHESYYENVLCNVQAYDSHVQAHEHVLCNVEAPRTVQAHESHYGMTGAKATLFDPLLLRTVPRYLHDVAAGGAQAAKGL